MAGHDRFHVHLINDKYQFAFKRAPFDCVGGLKGVSTGSWKDTVAGNASCESSRRLPIS